MPSCSVFLLKGCDYNQDAQHASESNLLTEQYKLRYRELVKKCGWKNNRGRKGEEADQYDTKDTEYLIALDDQNRVIGTLRIRPTTNDYMLSEQFSYFVTGDLPKTNKVFEASRLVLDRTLLNKEQRKPVIERLLLACMEIGSIKGIDAYIGFMIPKIWESTFLRCGWNVDWLGKETTLKETGEIVKAAFIPVDKTIETNMRQKTGWHDPILSFDTRIKQIIRTTSSISVEKFMSLATEHYYATRDPFGAGGDFTTAPEISQMFGELIGAWAANEWISLGRPNPFILLECGPGRGTLMADALRATRNTDGFHDALRLVLMETSPVLREKQNGILASYHPTWIENLNDPTVQSSGYPTILIANELLDALPIQQFQKTPTGWQERMVGLADDGKLVFTHQPLPNSFQLCVGTGNDEDIVEKSPVRENFIRDVCTLLQKHKGIALLIDYGHTESDAGDTFQAVKNHRFAPVLEHIGEADLTSHVDFSALRRVAKENKITCRAIVTQSEFLRNLGIEHRAATLIQNASAAQRQAIQSALNRLIGTDEMGDLFKVMILNSEGYSRPQ